ncbi:MAG TPA: HEAT repeat domain-containing protein [Thermoanaerobaculaceae bacterium]|nr:HEAT repeat domain-containing protein [Thermoanaerobaculaceae bacterium]
MTGAASRTALAVRTAFRRPTLAAVLLAAAGLWPSPALAAEPPAGGSEPRARLLALADARRFDSKALAALAADAEPAVRAETAAVLGLLANPGATPLVAQLARDRYAGVRAAAAAAAGRLVGTLPAGAHQREALGGELRRLLQDPAPDVRAAAAWGAGRALCPECDLWLLQRLGRERTPAVQAAILQELWRFPGTLWIKRATGQVTNRDPGVRYAAARSLARSGRPEAVAGLRRASRDADPLVRMAALEGARRAAPGALWRELLAGVADADARVRIAAMEGLANVLAREPARTLPKETVAAVTRALAGAGPQGVQERVVAVRLAGAARCCGAQLQAIVAAGEPWVAGEALAALVRTGEPGNDVTLRAWLASSELARRLAAVRALGQAAKDQPALLAALADPVAEVRLAAVETLRDGAGAAVTPAIAGRLADEDPVVRAAAVEALAGRKAAPAEPELLRLLGRERGAAVPDAAVALIGALGAGKGLPDGTRAVLEGLTGSPDPVVARAAWQVLAAHGVSRPLPEVKTGEDPAFYREVLRWASSPRWLEVVTVRGTLQIALDTASAPLACFRLAALADKKFFDGLTFPRVEPDFVVQGGDPRGDGWGGPGFVMRDELALTPFAAGAVGIALSGPDTGGSQLFVTLTPRPHLLGRYPHVGTVAAGFGVATRLRVGDRILAAHAGAGPLPTHFPVWYGLLDPARLDREIPGWHEEAAAYRPQEKWLDLLRSAKLRYGLMVAMGTWCSDSRTQIPRLQAVLAALGKGSPFDAPRLVGVDRSKAADPALYPFGPVDLVPTIVVTAGGAEVGRIVETPKSGRIEEDLVRILAPIEGWEVPVG